MAATGESSRRSVEHLAGRVTGRPGAIAETLQVYLPLAAILVVLALAVAALGPARERTVVTALISLVMVLGLFAFSGTSGIMSFGQTAFALVGAYVGGILAMPPDMRALLLPNLGGPLSTAEVPTVALPLVGGLVAALVALPLGLVIARLDGVVGSIGTFSVLVVGHEVFANLSSTNGPAGLSGVPADLTLVTVLAWALVALGVTTAFNFSRTGLMLRASREDGFAAAASGVDIRRGRLLGYLLSAGLFGIAGALYARLTGSFTPDTFYLAMTTLVIAMLVVGGSTSVTGTVIGTVGVSAIYQVFQDLEARGELVGLSFDGLTGLAETALAVSLLLVLMLRPTGITRGRELSVRPPRSWRRSRAGRS